MAGRWYRPETWVFVVNPTDEEIGLEHKHKDDDIRYRHPLPPGQACVVHPERFFQKRRGLLFFDTKVEGDDFEWAEAQCQLLEFLGVLWALDRDLGFE